MLSSTFDLITLAAASTNSLVAFCFCNLIIVILLVSSSKPISDVDEESVIVENRIKSYTTCKSYTKMNEVSKDVKEAAINNVEESPDHHHHEEEEEEEESQDCCEEANDDELRRRVEEFIEKVNRGWKAEKLRMYASARTVEEER
ncbi:hypothetical protein ACH5RR_017023 [Cinchona calisaya]|uniref:Uncharacterized protein n=1 Tax=Cinchona calisaya TaxID=153742 RepID=A0ABD2ZXL3_9GENT